MDGWVTAIFAAFSLMSGLFSIVGLLVGIGMAIVAYVEFSGARKLRSLDERAAKMLGWNQIGFAILPTAYACWGLYSTHTNPGRYKELIGSDPQLEQMLGPIEDIVKLMAMQAPIRGLPRTTGSELTFAFLMRARLLGEMVSPVISSIRLERSRMRPSSSKRPGFSLPFGP